MRIIRNIAELPETHGGALIPTLGALHEGHLALIRCAVETPHRPVMVSIFVNPTQFGPDDDLARYPRQLDADVEAAAHAGAEFVFTPSVETMYPPDEEIRVPRLPDVALNSLLEEVYRPGHFEGVCQAVSRLFDLIKPRCAIFGEKDYQQLLVIKAMVAQEGERWKNSGGTLDIIAHKTIREPDGLAMSSRNAYLDPEQRRQALGLSIALKKSREAASPAEAESIMQEMLTAHDLSIEYAVVRDARTLMPVDSFEHPTRALIAARLGDVRLIDNMAL